VKKLICDNKPWESHKDEWVYLRKGLIIFVSNNQTAVSADEATDSGQEEQSLSLIKETLPKDVLEEMAAESD